MNGRLKLSTKIDSAVGKTALKALFVSALLSLSISVLSPEAMAAIGSDARLSQLEVKFFKHTYAKDDDTARLERLEKMIFGEVRQGGDSDRLKNLADTVPNLSSYSADDASGQSGSTSSYSASSSAASSAASSQSSGSQSSGSQSSGSGQTGRRRNDLQPAAQADAANKVLAGESKYPSITALEQHLFNKDYSAEAVGDRLNRLETKVFGRPSKFTDLSDRVDALKEKTRVDIAKKAPPGSDWVDEDDDSNAYPPPSKEPVARSDGDDGRSFSGKDLRKDMQRAFGQPGSRDFGGGSAYGMSSGGSSSSSSGRSSGNSASGAYGMGNLGNSPSSMSSVYMDDDDDTVSPKAMRKARQSLIPGGSGSGSSSGSARGSASQSAQSSSADDAPMVGAVGLNQKVTSLENAVLGKTFTKDPLPDRVTRLEQTVLPKQADQNATLSLPVRVSKLLEKVPVSSRQTASAPPRSRRHNDDMDMDDDLDSVMPGNMTNMTQGSGTMTQQRGPGGLSKIINSIGNMLGSGYVGGYAMPSGGMVRDSNTGMLVDTMTGNLINPSTGQVVGRSTGYGSQYSTGYPGVVQQYSGTGIGTGFGMMNPMTINPYGGGYGTGYGAYPYGGVSPYNSFNNGFAPFGSPGMGIGGIRFGTGGLGIGTGGMGLGGVRYGGMWP